MPEKPQETYEELTLQVPAKMMHAIRQQAAEDFRTPAGQALFLLSKTTSQRGSHTPSEERLRAAKPLFDALAEAHLAAGLPSSRILSRKAGGELSHSSISAVLAGKHFPPWRTMQVIVAILGADGEKFRKLWADAVSASPQA